ncbi:MAG: BACON domain-containing protein [Bacteroidales bacterium]|nr:BACON domain-containing protein [Bacteroidales bacterium]
MVAGGEDSGGGDNPKKVGTRASSIAAGGEVRISFDVNHPWTVSFSEPWLSAFDVHSRSDYGEFKISAETNLTGAPREATMTIASQIYGEVTVRVIQESMVLPDFELTFSD